MPRWHRACGGSAPQAGNTLLLGLLMRMRRRGHAALRWGGRRRVAVTTLRQGMIVAAALPESRRSLGSRLWRELLPEQFHLPGILRAQAHVQAADVAVSLPLGMLPADGDEAPVPPAGIFADVRQGLRAEAIVVDPGVREEAYELRWHRTGEANGLVQP